MRPETTVPFKPTQADRFSARVLLDRKGVPAGLRVTGNRRPGMPGPTAQVCRARHASPSRITSCGGIGASWPSLPSHLPRAPQRQRREAPAPHYRARATYAPARSRWAHQSRVAPYNAPSRSWWRACAGRLLHVMSGAYVHIRPDLGIAQIRQVVGLGARAQLASSSLHEVPMCAPSHHVFHAQPRERPACHAAPAMCPLW